MAAIPCDELDRPEEHHPGNTTLLLAGVLRANKEDLQLDLVVTVAKFWQT